MPKENTHIYFADKVKATLPSLSSMIDTYSQYFFMGSIAPDTFFYSRKEEIQDTSDFLHGKHGTKTNEIVFNLLDIAKKNKDEKILVFVFGYLTHCYLDIVFHPIIFHLTGNFHDKDEHKRQLAVYKHRRREVQLDEKVNKEMHITKHIDKNIFTDIPFLTALVETLNIPQQEVILSFQRQYKTNAWFRKSKHTIKLLHFLHKLGIIKNKTELALFYGQLRKEEKLADMVHYKDLFSDELFSTDIESLFTLASTKAKAALNSAYAYYEGKETRAQAEEHITGENLDTGHSTLSTADIKS
jgi:hypothetical protein